MKSFFLILICALSSLSVLADEDTPILLQKDGSLVGLPKHYGPAHFDTASFTLTIGNKKITIPDCIKGHFKHYQNHAITFASSWYHDTTNFPAYMHLDITTKEEPHGYQLFFDLDTLEISAIWKPVVTEISHNTFNYARNRVLISEECGSKVSEAILTTHN